MYGLADISLFESVTNYRCTIFNDTYSDVVEDSDPLASRSKRIKELSKKNPVKKSKPEIIGDIAQKIKGKKEESKQKNEGLGSCLDTALGSLQKIEAHIKKIAGTGNDDEKGHDFVKKYGKKVKQVCRCANRAMSYLKKMDAPKQKMVIVIKHGAFPETAMNDMFPSSMPFSDSIGADITRRINDMFSF